MVARVLDEFSEAFRADEVVSRVRPNALVASLLGDVVGGGCR
ncbi:hypothetical protein Pan216_07380 [Planctomycetes bacterium Pan216]|uniref:Uncharacterized protein n=1 Tax=Kolteria novifilia TaxID=2527975 RepID=A0A518AYV7_9BACT|nr:hypothetical protein Pan216_07380 [Planctomycetes bacterium Pan216]